jgi:hypothetical protein
MLASGAALLVAADYVQLLAAQDLPARRHGQALRQDELVLSIVTRRLRMIVVIMSSDRQPLLTPRLLPEWELWACASECIRQHNLDAPIFAAMRADALLEAGDHDGASNWRLIVKRINSLLNPESSTAQ